jgi:hypothetical protein
MQYQIWLDGSHCTLFTVILTLRLSALHCGMQASVSLGSAILRLDYHLTQPIVPASKCIES